MAPVSSANAPAAVSVANPLLTWYPVKRADTIAKLQLGNSFARRRRCYPVRSCACCQSTVAHGQLRLQGVEHASGDIGPGGIGCNHVQLLVAGNCLPLHQLSLEHRQIGL